LNGVGNHPSDLRLVIDRVGLVAGAEVKDAALATPEDAAAAEYLAARER